MRHDGLAAAAVDEAADQGGRRTRHQQADGETAEDDGLAPAGVGGNGLAQHAQRVERRAPGDDLGDAERQDGDGCGMARERARARTAPALPCRSCMLRPAPSRFVPARAHSSAHCRLTHLVHWTQGAGDADIHACQEARLERPQGRRGKPAFCAGRALCQGRRQRRRGGGAGRGPAAARLRRATTPRMPRPWRPRWAVSRARS